MKIISRKNAIAKGYTKYFTGIPCKYNHIAKRHTNNSDCIECVKIRNETFEDPNVGNNYNSSLLIRIKSLYLKPLSIKEISKKLKKNNITKSKVTRIIQRLIKKNIKSNDGKIINKFEKKKLKIRGNITIKYTTDEERKEAIKLLEKSAKYKVVKKIWREKNKVRLNLKKKEYRRSVKGKKTLQLYLSTKKGKAIKKKANIASQNRIFELFKKGKRERFWRNRLKDLKFYSKRRNIKFNLNIDDLEKIWINQKGLCALTGVELMPGKNLKDLKKNNTYSSSKLLSFDRIENNIGYLKSNLRFVSNYANSFKGTLSNTMMYNLSKIISLKFKSSIKSKRKFTKFLNG